MGTPKRHGNGTEKYLQRKTEIIQDNRTEICSFVVQGHWNLTEKNKSRRKYFSVTHFFCSQIFQSYSRFSEWFLVSYFHSDKHIHPPPHLTHTHTPTPTPTPHTHTTPTPTLPPPHTHLSISLLISRNNRYVLKWRILAIPYKRHNEKHANHPPLFHLLCLGE